MYKHTDITVNGHHINEVQRVPSSSYVLQLSTLPGGIIDDYVAHICDCIDHIFYVP